MAILRKCSLLALAFICCVLVTGDIESQIASQAENSTAMRSIIAPAWVSSTNFRGTSDILQSCIATLTSCVYTAVHLNVPPNDVSGWWPLFLEKLKWMTVAILLPELVVYNAVSQLLEARWLQKELKRQLLAQQTVEDMATHHGTKPDYNLRWCFFVVMGGVKVPVRQFCAEKITMHGMILSQPRIPDKVTLTAKGVLQLVKSGHDLGITGKKIEERSKTDTMQKVIVAGQVLWMAIQCAARPLHGLPITLLEIHTMVHVLCALIMYGFWMKKPQDVQEPDVVDPKSWDHILALMVQATFFSQQNVLMEVPPDEVRKEKPQNDEIDIPVEQAAKEARSGSLIQPASGEVSLRPGDRLLSSFRYVDPRNRTISLTPTDVARWERAFEGLREIRGPSACTVQLWDAVPQDLRRSLSRGDETTESLRRFRRAMSTLLESPIILLQERLLFALMIVLSFTYGGLHLAAWGNHFPSSVEGLLWKVSCLVMMGMLPLMMALWAVFWMTIYVLKPSYEMRLAVMRATEALSLFLMTFYGLARIFVIVEAFISLRTQPIGVYWSPDWLQTVPHI